MQHLTPNRSAGRVIVNPETPAVGSVRGGSITESKRSWVEPTIAAASTFCGFLASGYYTLKRHARIRTDQPRRGRSPKPGGKDDGDSGFDFVDVDLLALPECLDEVEFFTYDPDYGNEPHLTRMGKKCKRDIVVEIYFEPFEDDETTTILGTNCGEWREKRMGQD